MEEMEPEKLRDKQMAGRNKPELGKEWENCATLATLMATVTFAAAFTVPGGYWSGDAGGGSLGGQPVLLWDVAFRVFLITDIVTMCTSLSVLFLYLLVAWRRPHHVTPYWKAVWQLMLLSFLGITVALATGVYTTIAPRMLWLAIFICVVCCIPMLTLASAHIGAMWVYMVTLLGDMINNIQKWRSRH